MFSLDHVNTQLSSIKHIMNKEIYILWIRHCESCSNVSKYNPMTGLFREPLCTKKGVFQSYIYGDIEVDDEEWNEYDDENKMMKKIPILKGKMKNISP